MISLPLPYGSGSGSDSGDSPSKYKMQPTSKPAAKRTNPDDTNNQHSGKSSKKSKSEPPVTRLWSNEDEITVLKGMDDFKNRQGSDPNSDWWQFHRLIKGNLQGDFSKEQLRCKIKNMKKRFLDAAENCEDGPDPVSAMPHSRLSFTLSKKIWGGLVDKVSDDDENHEANAKKDEEIGVVADEKLQPITKPAGKHTNPDDTNNQHSVKSSKKSNSVPPVTRLWSYEDETTVLNGMDDFKNRKGSDPNWDLGAFHRFIKGKLQGAFSKEQLRCKIKNMKKRFLDAAENCEDGPDLVFAKPHERLSFTLSKKIWGGLVDKVSDDDENHEANAKKDEEIGVVVDDKVLPVSKPGAKRTNPDDTINQHSVKCRKKSKSEPPVTRLWSNEDEITVLKGMDDFKNTKGSDSNWDLGAFYRFIKGNLLGAFSKEQLRCKIKYMKKQFQDAAKKDKDGSNPVFAKPHEHLLFTLSKKIWDGLVNKVADDDEHSVKSSKKSKSEPPVTRLWSNEDEITVLKGMDDFKNTKGSDSNWDLGAFYRFIKGNLLGAFSKEQLRCKIKYMKKQFQDAAKKDKDGSNPVFAKPHEHLLFTLSKKIWDGLVNKVADDDEHSVKSSKKSKSEPPVTRLWSNEDEITVLKGMYDFKNRKGSDPNWDLGAFHRFIKGNLQSAFSKEQLRCKIKNMKKRFLDDAKNCEDGPDPVFATPHKHLSFTLSKKIWSDLVDKFADDDENHEANAKKDEEIGVVVDEKEKDGEGEGIFLSKFPFLSASFDNVARDYPSLGLGEAMRFAKENLILIGSDTAKEFDDKWKQLLMEEMEIKYRMATFVRNQAINGV